VLRALLAAALLLSSSLDSLIGPREEASSERALRVTALPFAGGKRSPVTLQRSSRFPATLVLRAPGRRQNSARLVTATGHSPSQTACASRRLAAGSFSSYRLVIPPLRI
jgi:hypothetical protein